MKFIHKEYLPAAIWGLVAADALGVPYEFNDRDTFKVEGMTGYGTHYQPAGYWSDDSSMMLATLCSLLENDKINHSDIMSRFVAWRDKGEYSPAGRCFDIGMAVNRALDRFSSGVAPLNCGGRGQYDNGNGSLMRILPVAFIEHTDRDVTELSAITHANGISTVGCVIYVQIAERLMQGMSKEEALKTQPCYIDEYSRLREIAALDRREISSSGYVLHSLEAALWCLMTTDNYRDCVTAAVELGDDTDTVAAIAGGLAGIYYGIGGERGIPREWINTLAKKEWIEGIINKTINA